MTTKVSKLIETTQPTKSDQSNAQSTSVPSNKEKSEKLPNEKAFAEKEKLSMDTYKSAISQTTTGKFFTKKI